MANIICDQIVKEGKFTYKLLFVRMQGDSLSTNSGSEQIALLRLSLLGSRSATVPPSGGVPLCYKGHLLRHLCSPPAPHELRKEDQPCYGKLTLLQAFCISCTCITSRTSV